MREILVQAITESEIANSEILHDVEGDLIKMVRRVRKTVGGMEKQEVKDLLFEASKSKAQGSWARQLASKIMVATIEGHLSRMGIPSKESPAEEPSPEEPEAEEIEDVEVDEVPAEESAEDPESDDTDEDEPDITDDDETAEKPSDEGDDKKTDKGEGEADVDSLLEEADKFLQEGEEKVDDSEDDDTDDAKEEPAEGEDDTEDDTGDEDDGEEAVEDEAESGADEESEESKKEKAQAKEKGKKKSKDGEEDSEEDDDDEPELTDDEIEILKEIDIDTIEEESSREQLKADFDIDDDDDDAYANDDDDEYDDDEYDEDEDEDDPNEDDDEYEYDEDEDDYIAVPISAVNTALLESGLDGNTPFLNGTYAFECLADVMGDFGFKLVTDDDTFPSRTGYQDILLEDDAILRIAWKKAVTASGNADPVILVKAAVKYTDD